MNAQTNTRRLRSDPANTEPRIVAVTAAAPGWFVVWQDFENGKRVGEEERHPVAAWATVEFCWPEGNAVAVVAMTAEWGIGAGLSLAMEAEWLRVEWDAGESKATP